VLRGAIGSAVGIAFGAPALRFAAHAQSPPTVRTFGLSDDLHVLTVAEINVVAQTARDGVVLVDGGPVNSSAALLDAVAALPAGGPIHTLFNTHWHPEQTGLNERLGAEGAAIIAQENTRLWLTTDITYPWNGQHFEPLPKTAQPTETFHDDGELASGVRYGYLRHAAHTDGDLYVHFPDANVLAVGDTVSGAGWPLVDWWTGGWIGGIVGNLELLLKLTDAQTRIVPARGPVLARADLETQYEMYTIVYERLSELLNSGRGPDEAVAAHPTAEFDAAMGPSDEFVRRAFESLWAYLSPDASNRRRQPARFG
jgi:glyoxylase-like metal-dependent hydrolase (beta-lactamase superfamily II)